MDIKVKAKKKWEKGKIEGKQPEDGYKTVTITEKELIEIAREKMREDIHSGYQWAVHFSDFEVSAT